MNITWPIPFQISAGEFFELMRPVAFGISILLSACVLHDALCGGPTYRAFAWALATFLFPLGILPLYLIARFRRRSERRTRGDGESATAGNTALPSIGSGGSFMRALVISITYAGVIGAAGATLFYKDRHSVDAHMARAIQAHLAAHPRDTVREYHSALALVDDSHTHSLLAAEFADEGKFANALVEYRVASSKSNPDEDLHFNMAKVLEQVNRTGEAAGEYEQFLAGPACHESFFMSRCDVAQARVKALLPSH